MPFELPPAVKLAERLLKEIELAVSHWTRQHRYTHGAMLRGHAMQVAQLGHRAWRDRARTGAWTAQLVFAVDDLKLSLELGWRIKAFASFAQFELLIRLARALGRQCGGWHKQQMHLMGRNPAAPQPPPERAPILSARTAPAGANP